MALIRRYGRENWPLFITELPDPEKMELFDLEVEPEQIMETRERAEKMGRNRQYLTTMSFNRSSFLIRTDREEAKKGETP